MKLAELPDGRVLKFPLDMPDDMMDQHVREQMGVPEPVDEITQVRQMLVALTAGQQELLEAFRVSVQAIAAAQQQMAAISAQLARSIQENTEAQYAPKDIRFENGRPAGVVTKRKV